MTFLQMVTATLVHILKENLRDQANTNGKMVASILVYSKMDSKTEKESGRSDSMIRIVTCMRAPMKMIRKMVWACSHGKVEISTRGAIKMMSGTATVRCSGRMAPVIRVNGRKAYNTV